MRKVLEGIVVSIAMKDTAVVKITRRKPHPVYKKVTLRSKKYKASIGEYSVNVGDVVKLEESRPISKDKHFKIIGKKI